ncbi:MarR family winged helix-turn-helix transcriptional regulator [Niameybacter massiliensis]|uniref:MarR family winged helix-turn-helix transcriptional regulator n=1 Tax=Niameybacter massiliensis TaxID=1658108 RepID=UPI0009E225C7|nr:MarR family transcriptional regulator [Niameybacter massiliensis]
MKKEKHIGFEVKTLSNLIKRRFEEKLRVKNLDSLTGMQGWIIAYIHRQDNEEGKEIFQRDIEKEFKIRRSTATGVLQVMERDELIIREAVDYDARLKRIKLTPKAIKGQEMVLENIKEIESQLMRGLTQEEIETFFYLIDKIKVNVN